MNYVELHLHDHYSILDGLNTPEEYMVRAKEIGMTHLAQTNHGTLAGHREFQRAAKAAGIVPILGVEGYISETDRFDRRAENKREDGTQASNHIGILAMNENGLRNLNIINAEAWNTGFYYKPRMDFDLLEAHSDDLIVLSGCIGGLLGQAIETEQFEKALKYAQRLKDIFGERFFIEIQGHNPEYMNQSLMLIAEDLGIRPVVTSDCHYARKEDLWIENAMLIVATNPKPAKDFDFNKSQKMDFLERYNYLYPGRRMNFEEYEIHLRDAKTQHQLLAAQGIGDEPIENTNIIAGMIGEYPYYEALDLLPRPKVDDVDGHLEKKVMAGLKKLGWDTRPEYVARAREELDIIKSKGFSTYFLILGNAVQWAKKQGIRVGPGRGSAVSSLVNRALDITQVDPIEHNLLFFRFMDPDRDDWPDIDVDFEKSRRHEVKEYMVRQFKHVASIATFGYLKDKSVVRDAARVFKIPLGEVNKVLKNVDDYDHFLNSPATKEFREKYPEVITLANEMLGRIRSMGVHAGGLVVANQPIENYVPMQTAEDTQNESKERVPVIAYDMNEAAEIGLIKMDFLGLKTLDVIQDTLDFIAEDGTPRPELESLPLDDPKVYKMLSMGYTKGVFQAEAQPSTKLIMRMGVDNFDELVASNALVRPGAADSSFGENYIKGKKTGNFDYIHKDAKDFTQDTYGQIIYQEQQMLLCVHVAGMSMRDANKVRRAIGKKKPEELALWKEAFVDGASVKLGQRRAEELWHDLEAAANYSFNKSHAVAYSLLSYWTAWLKVHYPVQFMAALLKNEGDKDTRLDYLMEAKRLGIKILLPHVNASEIGFSIENGGIRFGLSNVKYISGKIGSKIIANRPFTSYAHLLEVSQTKGSGINARAIDSLNKVGGAAFDDNPRTGSERENFFEYLDIPAFDSQGLPPEIKVQLDTLDEFEENGVYVVHAMARKIKYGEGWALVDIVDETASVGVFTDPATPIETGRQYVFLLSANRIARFLTVEELMEGKGGAFGRWLEKDVLDIKPDHYRCVSFKKRMTKKGQPMANAVFTDADKNLFPAVIFPAQYDKAFLKCRSGKDIQPLFGEKDDGTIFVRNI